MPLPNTRVIPAEWSEHHRPTAEGGMTAECTITGAPSVGTVPVFDEALGYSPPVATTTVYTGICRVQRAVASNSAVLVADREVTVREYTVSIVAGSTVIQVNDLVTITANRDDPTLIGRVLRVRDARMGSVSWQRDLVCDQTQPVTR